MQHMIPRLLLFKYETGIFSMNLMHRAKFDMYTDALVLVDTMQGFHSSGPSIWLAFLLSPFAVWSDERRLMGDRSVPTTSAEGNCRQNH